jgi:hypothetical protein
LDKLIQLIAVSTVSIFVLSVISGIIYSIIIVKGEVLGGLIFLAVILGLVLFGILMLYRDSLLNASRKRQIQQPELLSHDTAKLLPESQVEPIPSVTDRTTDLLDISNRKSN